MIWANQMQEKFKHASLVIQWENDKKETWNWPKLQKQHWKELDKAQSSSMYMSVLEKM